MNENIGKKVNRVFPGTVTGDDNIVQRPIALEYLLRNIG